MRLVFVALATFQDETSPLNDQQLKNILLIFVALETFQDETSPLNKLH
eukprot:CAMPEP_0194029716 /NCGR_PEP_ID=MMETSP0009_2-20130614/3381_1 /TAXON_ID=210454 /ORGANISM="Grammatophora oceanica, Strain CCMP 410" /LENGTH=47 /DNA_ID= /DNA_START= /DNA_END= /DNA_ORIENTATION=